MNNDQIPWVEVYISANSVKSYVYIMYLSLFPVNTLNKAAYPNIVFDIDTVFKACSYHTKQILQHMTQWGLDTTSKNN